VRKEMVVISDVAIPTLQLLEDSLKQDFRIVLVLPSESKQQGLRVFARIMSHFPKALTVLWRQYGFEPTKQILSQPPCCDIDCAVVFESEKETLPCTEAVVANEFLFEKCVVVTCQAPGTRKSTYANFDTCELLQRSCLNFTILCPNVFTPGPATDKTIVCEDNPYDMDQQKYGISYGDLAFIILECAAPTIKRQACAVNDRERLCSIPRSKLKCYTYGPIPDATRTYIPKLVRQREKYGEIIVKAPVSRWGTLKFNQARPPSSLFFRDSQKLPKDCSIGPPDMNYIQLRDANKEQNPLPREKKLRQTQVGVPQARRRQTQLKLMRDP